MIWRQAACRLPQYVYLSAAGPGSAGGGAHGPGRLEGIAHGANSGGAGGAEHGAQHGRKHVGVLVGVDVREAQAPALEPTDLRGGFGLDLGGADAAGEEAATGTR